MQIRMHGLLKIFRFLVLLAAASSSPAGAAPSEKRLALVIGNGSYKAKTLATPANDAALIAQTLQAAGFDVTGARDLGGDALGQVFRDFIDRVGKAGPDAVATVYFAGYGLQLEGENYLVPVDADVAEPDVRPRALRLSEQTHSLAALHLKAIFVILDAAYATPFSLSGRRPAGGLAWVEPETNMLIAFNAAPGTVSPDVAGGYGPYAKALAEMIREGGLTPARLFDRVRLRVSESTKGAQIPWDATKIETQFMFFERGPGAPPRADSPEHTAWMRSKPMRSLGARDAYLTALARDTFDGYVDFLADYWHDPMASRVRALLAARREAIVWRRTYQANAPDAYWSYLELYPRGPHAADARSLLSLLGAAVALPVKFARMEYEVPPPLPDEIEYIERPALILDDPALALEPPQPAPANFLEPPPPELLGLPPPAAPSGEHLLPTPMVVSLPAYVRQPVDAERPPNPVVSDNAGETPAINSTEDSATKPDGQSMFASIWSARAADNMNSLAASSGLSSSVAPKTTAINGLSPPPPAVTPGASEQIKAPLSPPLSGVSSTPLLPTGNDAPASSGIVLSVLSTDIVSPLSVAAILAPLPLGNPLPTRRDAMLSPSATNSIPRPIPRPAALAPPPIRKRSEPIARPASVSSPTGTDQDSAPPRGSLDTRPASTEVVRPAEGAPGASPSTPQRKPCVVVSGKQVCS